MEIEDLRQEIVTMRAEIDELRTALEKRVTSAAFQYHVQNIRTELTDLN
jgi:hypothetical protein